MHAHLRMHMHTCMHLCPITGAVVPQGSDESFLGKLLDEHKESTLIKQPTKEQSSDSCAFTLVHFVGPVVYSATGMLIKNKDPISQDLMVLLQHSTSLWVKGLFGDAGGDAKPAAPPSCFSKTTAPMP